MGRPIKKTYFGNTNFGSSSTTADNGIGGEGVASVTLNALGSYTTRPTITFAVPTLPDGVRATGTITSEVVTAAVSNGLTGEGYEVGDLVTFDGIAGVTGYVATVGSGVGEIQSITFTQDGTSRGEFTTLPADLTDVAVIGGSGTLSTVNISFRAKAVVITEAGSGYASAPTPTFTQSVTATSVNMTTSQRNALAFTSYLTTGSNAVTGGDIIKQQASRRYLVQNSEGIGQVKLVADTPAAGEMTLVATDTDGATYYVVKLTAHKATLVNISGTPLFDDNSAVGWVIGTNADTSRVSIASN